MKSKKSLLIRLCALALLLAIAGAMFVIGRGHTVYFDNKTLDYNGTTYPCPYKVTVMVKGEQAAKLYAKERGMATWIGQNFKMTLKVIETKGGEEVTKDYSVKLPYGLDGIVLNLPGLMAGLPEDAYLSEFVSLVPEAPEETEEIITDDFGVAIEAEPVA